MDVDAMIERGDLLDSDAAAAYLGIQRGTLHHHRAKGYIAPAVRRVPPGTNHGIRVYYTVAELDAYRAAHPPVKWVNRKRKTQPVVVVSKKAKPAVDDAVTPTPVAAPPRPVRMQEPPTNKRPAPKPFRNATDLQDARRLWEGMRAIWAADKKQWAADLREIIAWEKAHPETLNRPSGKAVCP